MFPHCPWQVPGRRCINLVRKLIVAAPGPAIWPTGSPGRRPTHHGRSTKAKLGLESGARKGRAAPIPPAGVAGPMRKPGSPAHPDHPSRRRGNVRRNRARVARPARRGGAARRRGAAASYSGTLFGQCSSCPKTLAPWQCSRSSARAPPRAATRRPATRGGATARGSGRRPAAPCGWAAAPPRARPPAPGLTPGPEPGERRPATSVDPPWVDPPWCSCRPKAGRVDVRRPWPIVSSAPWCYCTPSRRLAKARNTALVNLKS